MAIAATILMWLSVAHLTVGLLWWLLFSARSTVASAISEFADYVELRGRPATRLDTKRKQRTEAREIIGFGVEVAWWDLSPLTLKVSAVWLLGLALISFSYALGVSELQQSEVLIRALGAATSISLQTIDALTFNAFSFAGLEAETLILPEPLRVATYLLTLITALALAHVVSEIASLIMYMVLGRIVPRSLASRLKSSQKKQDLLQRLVR